MRPSKDPKRRNRSSSSSPPRARSTITSGPDPTQPGSRKYKLVPLASRLDRELVTQEEASDATFFEDLQISPDYSNSSPNPRSFPYSVKQQCWEKAEKVKGRAPDRWRRDAIGNIVFRKLVGCPGCLCHDYDHIMPYSKDQVPGRTYAIRDLILLWYIIQ